MSNGVPVDPHPDAAGGPAPLDARSLGLVALGGAVGAVARHGLSIAVDDRSGLPWGTLIANVGGAFALGLLLELLARRGPDTGTRRDLRLALGTGVLGGFTTYSSFAVQIGALADRAVLATAYAVGSVLTGVVAAWCGVLIARRVSRSPDRRRIR